MGQTTPPRGALPAVAAEVVPALGRAGPNASRASRLHQLDLPRSAGGTSGGVECRHPAVLARTDGGVGPPNRMQHAVRASTGPSVTNCPE